MNCMLLTKKILTIIEDVVREHQTPMLDHDCKHIFNNDLVLERRCAYIFCLNINEITTIIQLTFDKMVLFLIILNYLLNPKKAYIKEHAISKCFNVQ